MTRPVVSKIFWNVNNDNDRCWKNATTLFSLRTFIFTMTGAENKLSSYFCFPDDRSWKKRQLFCLHTFTFTMTGTGKTKTFMSPPFHIHGACLPTNHRVGAAVFVQFPLVVILGTVKTITDPHFRCSNDRKTEA